MGAILVFLKANLLSLIVKAVTSNMAETLIAMGVKKLLASKTSGIGKELATSLIDAVAKSKMNDVPENAFDAIKQTYLGK